MCAGPEGPLKYHLIHMVYNPTLIYCRAFVNLAWGIYFPRLGAYAALAFATVFYRPQPLQIAKYPRAKKRRPRDEPEAPPGVLSLISGSRPAG